jgi:hypothetical protein
MGQVFCFKTSKDLKIPIFFFLLIGFPKYFKGERGEIKSTRTSTFWTVLTKNIY